MAKTRRPLAETEATGAPMDSGRCRRIVVKLGTNLLTAGTDRLNLEVMSALVGQIARLMQQGGEAIVVSSGAIACGLHRLGEPRERKDIPFRQVLASVGQTYLMRAYEELFAWHDIVVAQTLLTRRDLSDRQGYLNARNTLLALLEVRAVPIVNENDVVAVDEIEGAKIGDNDNLSALVANLVDADLLVLLTDTAGLFTADPRLDPQARLIPRVERVDSEIEALAGAGGARGVGGMATKVQAARLATAGGTNVVIADGHRRNILTRLVQGEAVGTFFPASGDRMESRKRWMVSGLSLKGSIAIDSGATQALRKENRSLLPAGVHSVSGPFERGDVIAICDSEGRRIACGIANYSSADIEAIRGQRSDRIEEALGYEYGAEVVHRDNLVLL